MKTVILAGGKGRRMCAESTNLPKPLVQIGDKPILWHVMDSFSLHGLRDFIIVLGFQSDKIFAEMKSLLKPESITDHTTEEGDRCLTLHRTGNEWSVTFVDTGSETQTGGRVKRIRSLLDSTFFLSWCDGLSDIDMMSMLSFHRNHGRMVTVAAVHPRSRFGVLQLSGDHVAKFDEKPELKEILVNSGFFIVEPEALDYITEDHDCWETKPMGTLVKENQLMAWQHSGNWQCMDTMSDWELLDDMWMSGSAFWKKGQQV